MKTIMTTLLFAFSLLAKSQNYGELGGIIRDAATGEAMPFANISVEQDSQIIAQGISDEQGKYLFSRIPSGTYILKVSYTGYGVNQFENLVVRTNELALYPLDVQSAELPVVVIMPDILIDPVYGGEELPATVIKNMPARSPAELVAAATPNIYASDGGEDGNLYISGSRSDATLYIIDGIRVIGSSFVPKNAISSITVYTSGIPANFGDVTGGVIEIKTKNYAGIW
jgi:hypothetical protein